MPAAAPGGSDLSKTPFVLEVEHFRALDALQDDRIVYYQSADELNYYDYHRWSSEPGTLVAELAARRLGEMGVFAQVHEFSHTAPADYVLRGRVLDFEEVDYEGGGRGRAALELSLIRNHDRKVIWMDRREREQAVQGKGLDGVVRAVSAAMSQVLNELLPELATVVAQDYKTSSSASQK
jgi:ABC-type uncharacterized transport system auxiliary subunit